MALVKSVWAAGREEMLANERAHLAEFERINKEHVVRREKLWGSGGYGKKKNASSDEEPKKKFTLSEKEGKEESRMDVFERQLAMEMRS